MYKKRQGVGSWIATIVLTLYCLIAVVLIGNMIVSSFKTKQDLLFNTFGFPTKISLENYKQVLVKDSLYKNFLNSIILTTLSIASLVFFSSMTAHGLSRCRVKGRQAPELYFLLGFMFPIQIVILPLFIIMRTLKLTNTFLGMILLYTANMSFSLFIFTQFFKELPAALHESAVIDGASEMTIFWRIMMPISKPVIFTVMTVSFVQIWNDFYLPLVFLAKRSLHTLTLAIYQYLANFLAYWNFVFAAATLALIPVIIVFLVFSDQIISGLAAGSIKE
ncbi:MAG: carbohydrate ABC transporter permease [Spirochaetales bacterium]|nr:carbohydrate ABC transporter permease [Spirochaetales bacterium]